jgi:hypothetical protein
MVQPQVSLEPRVQPLQELPQVWPHQVCEQAAAHWLLGIQS